MYACYNYERRWHNCLNYRLSQKHYNRCIIVDIENIDAGTLRECSAGGKGFGEGVHCQDIMIIYKEDINIK